ncbi:MAG: hypothetical protein ACI9TH_001197, partial [Kiritimatiellia bacterium]
KRHKNVLFQMIYQQLYAVETPNERPVYPEKQV